MSLRLNATDDIDTPVLPRRRMRQDAELDITPMIDVTFLLLIFFLVASIPDEPHALELPKARHGVAVSSRTSIIITIADGGRGKALVYLADGKIGSPLEGDPIRQEAAVREYVEREHRTGKQSVIIKAERGLRHGDVSRVAAVAGSVEGVKLNLAVMETD